MTDQPHRIWNRGDVWAFLAQPRLTPSADDFRSIGKLCGLSATEDFVAITAREGSRWEEKADLVDVVFRYRPEIVEALKRTFGVDTWFVEKPIKRWVVRVRDERRGGVDRTKDRIFECVRPFVGAVLDGNARRIVRTAPVAVPAQGPAVP